MSSACSSGDRALAEDMCQEVFLRVYQGLPGFNLRCRFTTWLFQVAKHRVLDELRARGRRATTPVDIDTLPQALLAREPVVGVEDMDAVFRAIGSLSDDLKMALVLRDVVGLSYNEIAETLEISLATTKWRIYKAREFAGRPPGRGGRAAPPRPGDPRRDSPAPARVGASGRRWRAGWRAAPAGPPRGSRSAFARCRTRSGESAPTCAARSSNSHAARGIAVARLADRSRVQQAACRPFSS